MGILYASYDTLPSPAKPTPYFDRDDSLTAKDIYVTEVYEPRFGRTPVKEATEEIMDDPIETLMVPEERAKNIESTPPLIRLQKCEVEESPEIQHLPLDHVEPFEVVLQRGHLTHGAGGLRFDPGSEQRRSTVLGELNSLFPERPSASRQLFTSYGPITPSVATAGATS